MFRCHRVERRARSGPPPCGITGSTSRLQLVEQPQEFNLMARRSCGGVTFIVLGLVLTATSAAAQTPPRATTAVDLSTALEATTRLASPAVVQIFTTSFKPNQGLLP